MLHRTLLASVPALGIARLAFCFCSILAAHEGCICSTGTPGTGDGSAAAPAAFGCLAAWWEGGAPFLTAGA